MKRTVSLKLELTPDQAEQLDRLQAAFSAACNLIVPVAAQDKCSNRVKLHHAGYYKIRDTSLQLGSQMACNADMGVRSKHRFSCPFCGRLAHADLNAGQNIASLGCTAVLPTGAVNRPNVAALTA